ncbi:MAG: hypothetical protein IGS49_16150 [Chlorogloeopsis fritschii C42_A2020_084]|uniref:hypothetical protein n=1 Tax=Chlorogloeopsis fritschii TaxID=1124 RepID=UPI0019F3D38F|nr:hypothetical protein [Chlorogloeopsis fritschii]MBF2006954.1 hypothetical protein [Chlorogloeopsis fritschii C42_A2020_084]
MALKLKALGGLLVMCASAIAAPSVVAQETQAPNYEYEIPAEVIDRAFFENSPNFHNGNNFKSDIDLILGPGSLLRNSFPENKIARDAELVNIVYQDVLYQQVSSDPYLRTPDLPNPYNTSLLMSPRLNANQLKVGTEYRFEEMQSRLKSD